MKATAVAPSNIAFVKYWGRKDEELRLPENGSISMNVSNLLTTTTVEFDPNLLQDEITLYSSSKALNHTVQGEVEKNSSRRASLARTISYTLNSAEIKKISKHLDRIRKLVKIDKKAKVVSKNNFPRGTGLSSSASGFAALTVAASNAAGLKLSEKELSILARLGSGSACRSIPDGFVEWLDGNTSETSYAYSIFPPEYWDISDVVVILTEEQKDVSTTEGQKLATSSPFHNVRQDKIKDKIAKCKAYIKAKNFNKFGELLEAEALELHAIMLTSHPSLIYWYPATITVMKAVKKWRKEGLEVYFTINTGQNIHLICQQKDAEKIASLVKEIPEVKEVIINTPSKGTHIVSGHLF